ncbi:hypothetical protein [Streptomyces lavendulocolor]|uniref:hypothetical protein n=1 Tax=Streptomyces lavendulocolor TaxID=67316 RepID=UPI0033CB3EC2
MNVLLCGLAENPALPAELMDRLVAVADTDVAGVLARRADLTHDQAVALVARVEESAVPLAYGGHLTAADIDPVTRPDAALALLDRGAGAPWWARLLVTGPVVARRERLAACPGLPSDVVEALATDPELGVVAELALWTTSRWTAGLAAHPHADVRRAVAANEAAPAAVLTALVTGDGLPPLQRCPVCDREDGPSVHDPRGPLPHGDLLPGASCDGSHESAVHDIRLAALQNPATPVHAVTALADHPSRLLRQALAARPDLPAEVCRRLVADPVAGVRAELAANAVLDDTLVRVPAADRDPAVRRAAAHNPRVPLDVLDRLADTVRLPAEPLPRIAAASPAEVGELARSGNPAVRMLVAQRRDLPADVRDMLAADPDAKVVASVAAHPGLAEARLRAMVRRHGDRVAAAVAANPDASPALLEDLAGRRPPVRKALREIARHRHATAAALLPCLEDARTRPVAAAHPALPPPLVAALLTDADRQTASSAAANPSLPPSAMSRLLPRR